MVEKTELKAAAARLLYNNNRDTADYNMIVDYIDNSRPIVYGTWGEQKLFDDGFGGGRVGYLCPVCQKYVPCKGKFCIECGARMDGDAE